MRTYNAISNPYQEKGYLEPKTQGQTYLEWLSQPRRSVEADLARLRQLWKDEPRVREQLVQLAKEFRFHGAAALRLAPLPGCRAALHAAVQGIIRRGLA
jgi:hypothetical protein